MEQNNWINSVLENTKKIKRVEAPPFLFTRIEQKLKNAVTDSVAIKWVTASVGALIFLVLLNFVLIRKTLFQKPENKPETELALSLGLDNSNQLYTN